MNENDGVPPAYLRDLRRAQEAYQQFMAAGGFVWLEKAAAALEYILNDKDFAASSEPFQLGIVQFAGVVFRRRYHEGGRLDHLDRTIALWKAAALRCAPGSSDRAVSLNNMANILRDRFARTEDPAELNTAIDTYAEVVDLTPVDSPDYARHLHNLGLGLFDRYKLMGDAETLDKAIDAFLMAVCKTEVDLPERASRLGNLGISLRARYEHAGNRTDLETALNALMNALWLYPNEAEGRARHLNALGNVLLDRYESSGRLADLNGAIASFESALEYVPNEGIALAIYLSNLGNGLRKRYAQWGKAVDLDAAIRVLEDAIIHTPPDSHEMARHLSNFAAGLYDRYMQTGQLADLEAVISACQDALGHTAPTSPNRPAIYNNLGVGLRNYFRRSRRPADLDAAIATWREAIERAPTDSPERIGYQSNLANGLRDRYLTLGDMEDLNIAIALMEEVVGRVSSDSPERLVYLGNLGNGLRDRYVQTGDLADLDAAIVAFEDVVDRIPTASPDRAMWLLNLGNALGDRYTRIANQADLANAVAYARNSCLASAEITGELALATAHAWSGLALRQAVWDEALQAAAQGRATLRRLDEANVLASERLSWRREVQGLAAVEAYAHARRDDAPAAVLALETGQASQLNAALGRGRDRELLEQLRSDDPALFAAYESAAAEVRAVGCAGGDPGRITLGTQPGTAAIRARAAAAQTALDDMVARITARPTYKTLFAPPAFADVAAAVGDAPLAYLATTPAGSVVLLLHRVSDQVVTEVLWSDLTKNELVRLLVRGEHEAGNVGPFVGGLLPAQVTGFRLGGELAAVLPALGERLMAPLAVRLRELGATAITLIPSGWLNLLPLHAASYEVNGAPRAFLDEFAVTFSPSAQTIVESRARAAGASSPAAALVVGNPQPVEPPLRYAHDEAEEVATILGAQAAFAGRVNILYEADATLSTVGAALPGKRVLHFACHGTFDPGEPLDSGLLMANGEMLTLRSVRDGAALAGARLVVLSACQTGLTDFRELPDEVIGLPAGFLAAGAAGVVGSLWPVDDRSTALLMTDFHRRVLSGTSLAEALHAAQLWLRSVTWGELDAYYTKFLPRMSAESAEDAQVEATQHNPNDAAYAEPYHWAAFTFSGA